MLIPNPILPGFHPDPSICRCGDDYYLATSTFEWWPGVRLLHSRDLANWQLVGHALDRPSQLDMRGNPDSGGVWAPALSHADGQFWLCYSDVKALQGPCKDVRNYLVTAERIEGPWSDPVVLNGSGFDPSLFHAPDGRKWFLNQSWEYRPDGNCFAGILLQEYCPKARSLVGEPRNICSGSELGYTEGPHLYFKDGFHYLFMAEGGTGFDHAETVARSRAITGPYAISPHHPLVSARDHPDLGIQKTGHGSMVRGPDDRWYLVHLCARPIGPGRHCILGRETALQVVEWPAGEWPRLATGGPAPAEAVELPGVTRPPSVSNDFVDSFEDPTLGKEWNTLRQPAHESWLDVKSRPGCVRLKGRHSLQSTFDQSLIATRLTSLHTTVQVTVDFAPGHYQQTAGLVFYYNTRTFHYLQIGWEENLGRVLRIMSADADTYQVATARPVPLPDVGKVRLRGVLADGRLQFAWSLVGQDPVEVEPELDATILSDDHVIARGQWGFTACFAGLCAQDATDRGPWAEFSDFARLDLAATPAPAITRAIEA